jgi:hypothetical protein
VQKRKTSTVFFGITWSCSGDSPLSGRWAKKAAEATGIVKSQPDDEKIEPINIC